MSKPADTPAGRPLARVIAVMLAAVLLLIVGIFLGRLMFPPAQPMPSTTSAEAGFARDMQTHHQQAVEMAMIIREKSDTEAVRTLAYDIATSQGQQAGQMFGWLTMWGLPQAPAEPTMTWMMQPTLDGTPSDMGSAPVSGMTMPGFATNAQIDALEAASGKDADKMFLELMIAHHAGGVEMAQALLDRSTDEVATSLAERIVRAQQSEMTYMKELLAAL